MRTFLFRQTHDAPLRRRPSRVRAWVLVLMAGAIGSTLSACATTKAAPVVAGPPLVVSQPPPRVLVPPEEVPLVATGNGPDTPVVTSSPRLPPPPPPQRRTTPPRASDSDPRTETPAAATAIGPNLPTEATRELRAVPSAAEPVPEQKAVQDQLERVKAELGKIVPSTLSSGDKRKFEDAKKFAAQASEKLKERNVLNAAQSVAKASQLLQDLSRR